MRTAGSVLILVVLLAVVVWAARDEGRSGGYIIGYPSEPSPETVTSVSPAPVPVPLSPRTGADERAMTPLPAETQRDSVLQIKEETIESLTRQLAMRDKKIVLLEERVNNLTRQLEEREATLYMMRTPAPHRYEVRKGDSLWRIAARADVYGNPFMWIKIYNANMSKIQNPNVIYPGQLFDIP